MNIKKILNILFYVLIQKNCIRTAITCIAAQSIVVSMASRQMQRNLNPFYDSIEIQKV